jgi:hypothetical protein
MQFIKAASSLTEASSPLIPESSQPNIGQRSSSLDVVVHPPPSQMYVAQCRTKDACRSLNVEDRRTTQLIAATWQIIMAHHGSLLNNTAQFASTLLNNVKD